MKLLAKLRHGIKSASRCGPLVNMPPEQVLRARGSIVVSLRRPENPALPVGMGKQRKQLLAVLQAIPANRAVPKSGHGDRARRGNVHAPGGARAILLPLLASRAVKQPKGNMCPKQ